MHKKILFLFIVLNLSYFHIANGAILLNEIMYDLDGTDTGREWIEIFNNGSDSIDLSTYKFFEANTNHGLSISQGDKNIGAGGYAVIVSDKNKFKIDWPFYTGAIFDSTFSLSNDGEILAIKDADLNIVDQYTYVSTLGATGDGKSLQKINNSWSSATPTPGMMNTSGSITKNPIPNENIPTTENTSTTSSSSAGTGSIYKLKKIESKIIKPNLVFVSLPTNFSATTTGEHNEPLYYGKYFWNFGDGSSMETDLWNLGKISHTYHYPGEYMVSLEYYGNIYSSIPTSVDKAMINVVSISIIISAVGNEQDFFVEIFNNFDYDMDVSNWYLSSLPKTFVFPKNTVIPSKKKIMFSPKVTGFVFADLPNLKLINSVGQLVFDFNYNKIIPIPIPIPDPIVSKRITSASVANTTNSVVDNNNKEYISFPIRNDLQAEDLQANVLAASNENITKTEDKNYYLIFGFVMLLLVGAVGVYLIRKRKIDYKDGDEYEIDS
ncbi:MAG: lamin tail domain-containing protein [bacterium]|nr:lamin tail domain-containing protein [bacterium]